MMHSTIAKIERRTAGIREESEKRMAWILETCSLQIAPQVQGSYLKIIPHPFCKYEKS